MMNWLVILWALFERAVAQDCSTSDFMTTKTLGATAHTIEILSTTGVTMPALITFLNTGAAGEFKYEGSISSSATTASGLVSASFAAEKWTLSFVTPTASSTGPGSNSEANTNFDAGSSVSYPDDEIEGTTKTWKDMYSNAKAQNQAITAQKLYNTFRFIKLGEQDIDSSDMISIDIKDDVLFNKLVKELSSPIWVKSATNSKKKVESKKDMEKRTGQKSPNISDAFHMTQAPQEQQESYGLIF